MRTTKNRSPRTWFSKTPAVPVRYPDLLDLQFKSFNQFFHSKKEKNSSNTLHSIFKENFPISDAKKYFTLEYLDYFIENPIYTPSECLENGINYDAALKVVLRITTHEEEEKKVETKTLFFGNIPYMTPKGSFIINGIERVVVPQIHRSYGIFFTENMHISGEKLFSAKIIPQRGTWLEFSTDLNKSMYAYINYRKKFLVTVLLRIIGYGTDKDILELFGLSEEVLVNKTNLQKHKGRRLAAHVLRRWTEEYVDEETSEIISLERSEILLERDTEIGEEQIDLLLKEGVKSVTLHKSDKKDPHYLYLYNTLERDETTTEKEAIDQVYRQLRGAEPPDAETARHFVFDTLLSSQRSYLGKVGRYCINRKLGLNVDPNVHVLTKEDLLRSIEKLFLFVNGKMPANDIDHLGNRRVKVVGEQLHEVFSVAINRMARTISDRMNVRTADDIELSDLVSTKTITTMVNTFFQTNPLSQFMDQTNALSELSHKRRITALGPKGLDRNRTGFEPRDVHWTHWGRLCPISTPEGLNIGLIFQMANHARVNAMGFIETPCRRVVNGRVDLVSEPIYYSAEDQKDLLIAHGTTKIDKEGYILEDQVKVSKGEDFIFVDKHKVDLIDLAKDQIVSAPTSLIPYLSNNEAGRGLMASNMQRQAVPLLRSESPIVGTGAEKRVVKDGRTLIKADHDGVVTYVDATKVVLEHHLTEEEELQFLPKVKTYYLKKMRRTNNNTCINQEPIVVKGQQVKKGDSLCEGFSIEKDELALGKNVRVAFLPHKGGNFEDAIVISERVVKDDTFTSVHLLEYELDLCDTKYGPEAFTDEIPNVSEQGTRHLDASGLAVVGTAVKEGDILIGRVTPKGQSEQTPEGQILQSIFGKDIYNKKDTSLRVPPAVEGVVVRAEIKERVRKDKATKAQTKEAVAAIRKDTQVKLQQLRSTALQRMMDQLAGQSTNELFDRKTQKKIAAQQTITKAFLEKNIFGGESRQRDLKSAVPINQFDFTNWTADAQVNKRIGLIQKGYMKQLEELEHHFLKNKLRLEVGHFLPLGIFKKAKVTIAKKRKLKVGDKMAGRHGNKGIVSIIEREEDMPYLADGTPMDIVLNPLGLPSRMNYGQLLEVLLSYAGFHLNKKYSVPNFDEAPIEQISEEIKKAGLPPFGREQLYDGETGEPFENLTSCGFIYMMKLGHLVDDKMHARSTGPYALITQQPLGGKAQFGGQRLGEMEVWALEAYGAAYTLQECLTLKSDDIYGRRKTSEAIVKGDNLPRPSIPESFKVLVHKLRGVGMELTPLK